MITNLGKFNYLRLTDNQFNQILSILADIKYDMIEERPVKIHINENGLAVGPVGSALPVSSLPISSVCIVPKLMNNKFDNIDFYMQNDDLGKSFIGQNSDGEICLYDNSIIKESNIAFIYSGYDAKQKYSIVKDRLKKKDKYRNNIIIEIFLGHKPLVLDEIVYNKNFTIVENPYRDMANEYNNISNNIYNEAMSLINTNNFLEASISKINKMMEDLKNNK